MFFAYVVVAVLTAAANVYAAINDFIRPKWLLTNMAKLGVPESRLAKLGLLKGAGSIGLLVGIAAPWVGTLAAVGLILFFVAAILTHLRASDRSFGAALGFLLLAVASLVLGLCARSTATLTLIGV